MSKEETAVAVYVPFNVPALAMDDPDFMEDLEGVQIRFPKIKIPSGGGVAWEIPSDDPESPDIEKVLTGVIMDHYLCNGFWEKGLDDKDSDKNAPPDCSSMDGKIGVLREGYENPHGVGGQCVACPANQYGSDPRGGKGKWCKNMRRIFILREEQGLPNQINVPPTSLRNFDSFMSERVVGRGRKSSGVVTKLTLKKVKNANGIDYAEVQLMVDKVLSKEQAAEMSARSKMLKPFTRKVALTDEDAVVETPPTQSELSDEDVPI